MKNFVEEFKAFAVRGNVVDLAVAVVIGTAFGKIVSSLVENIIMPVIGIILGGVDFTGYVYTVGEGETAASIGYGMFIQSVFDFAIIAFAIFLAIKALKKLEKPAPAPVVPAAPSEEVVLLREIRDSLRK